ncbi:MAG: peptidoglycan-binding protein [Heteroscytonema crispum UTEX LB 1556]
MENLAYLHLAFAYEDGTPSELVSFSCLLQTTAAPNWKRLSSRAWSYMLPLALTVSILSAVGSALALERGDQGPSVRNLQQQLQKAGFLQAPITQVFDFPTEDAVRRFQKTAGLPVDGIASTTTIQKLQGWRSRAIATQPKKPVVVTTPTTQATTTQNRRTTQSTTERTTVTSKRGDPNFLGKGDEGEEVRILQEQLRVAGFYYGNSNGVFGPITEEAVKRFQTAYNLDADGIVGPATLRRLPTIGIGYGEDVSKRSSDDKLRLGDRGESVRILQTQLIKAGYLEGEPNAYYGPYTADAVRRFQAANYLAASGIAGPTTRAKLHDLVNTAPRSEFNVLEIQRRLNSRGFYKGPLNGVMGDDTKDAIKQAQEFYGISLNDIRSGRF